MRRLGISQVPLRFIELPLTVSSSAVGTVARSSHSGQGNPHAVEGRRILVEHAAAERP